MSDVSQLRDTITPKSDQLNADDLMVDARDITVTAVKRGNQEQPVSIHYQGDDGRPFKPCKSMRRVLITAWGDDGRDWVGKSMRLYCDPEVRFGGVAVGGIRISHVSHIDRELHLALTTSRSKRSPYIVKPMAAPELPPYPEQIFQDKLPAITETITTGKMTNEQAITHLQKTGQLTDDQRATIRAIQAPPPS